MLSQKSLVKNLKLYNYKIDICAIISDLVAQFRANPQLPGAAIFDGNLFLGAISQIDFWKYMSRPYSLELSGKRQIEYLLDFIEIKHLVVAGDEAIVKAAEIALQRPAHLLEQPIIVKINSLEYGLLDTHQLLISYTAIYRQTSKELEQSKCLLEATNAELEATLGKDPLTGLGNQNFFETYLLQEWERSAREQSWISLIRFDLDVFQKSGNYYTQVALNDCLRQIGSEIPSLLNNDRDTAIHYGQGRFVIIIVDLNTIDTTRFSETIATTIRQLKITNLQTETSENLSFNLGIASIKPDPRSYPEDLLMAAEEALERAKQIGKNIKIVTNVAAKKLNPQTKLIA